MILYQPEPIRTGQKTVYSQFAAWKQAQGLQGDAYELLNSERLDAQQRAYIDSIIYLLGGTDQ